MHVSLRSLSLASLVVLSFHLQAQTPINSITDKPSQVDGLLPDGTPVKLRLAETVSSSTARTGQEVPFEVTEDVQVQGTTVIQKGAIALATVTDAEHKKTMGRGGRLDINIDSVRLIDNEKVQLRATAGGKAGGHTGAMTGAMVATGVLFFPAAPLFLFMHGKDITLSKGLETIAFVEGDTKLDIAQIAKKQSGDSTTPYNGASLSQISVESNVPNCDINIDGAFTGTTPSTLSLASGKHQVVIHKAGYADWTRTLVASGSAVRLSAELEPTPPAR